MPMRGGSDKITWICESPGPTSAGKPPKSEAKIPLVHTKSLISWSRCYIIPAPTLRHAHAGGNPRKASTAPMTLELTRQPALVVDN